MKTALISDIHGNLEALTAALESLEKRQPDKIICLGDIVGYGANPGECLDLVRSQASAILLGNHDAAAVGKENLAYFNEFARAAVIWTKSVLTPEQKDFIAALPLVVKQDGLHLVHAAPKNPQVWDYIFSYYDAGDQFDAVDGRICFVGHSHVPGDYREVRRRDSLAVHSADPVPPRRIVNIGSVGQPRDRNPRLCYVIYDTESDEVQFIREEYDVETASAKILRAGLPVFLAERLFWGY